VHAELAVYKRSEVERLARWSSTGRSSSGSMPLDAKAGAAVQAW